MDAIKLEPSKFYHLMALSTEGYAFADKLPPSLDDIATEYYGKQYVGQQTGDMVANDTAFIWDMTGSWVDEYFGNLNYEKTYLGLNRRTGETVYADCTPLEYWLSLRHDPENPDNEHNPESGVSYFGQSFKYDFQVYREAPEPQNILAGLIKGGILPKGRYLIEVSW